MIGVNHPKNGPGCWLIRILWWNWGGSIILLSKNSNLAEKIQKNQTIYPDFRKIALVLLGISLPLVILLYFFSIPIFELVFGSEWTMAGEITALLVIGQTIKFIVSPLSSNLIALKEVRFSALWQILYFGAMYWLYLNPGQDIQEFVWRYCLIDLIAYSFYYGLIYNRVKHYEKLRSWNNWVLWWKPTRIWRLICLCTPCCKWGSSIVLDSLTRRPSSFSFFCPCWRCMVSFLNWTFRFPSLNETSSI